MKSICFISIMSALFSFSAVSSAQKQNINTVNPTAADSIPSEKNITAKKTVLELQKRISGTLSVSLDPDNWQYAQKLIKEASVLEKGGKRGEADAKYSAAGEIMLSIVKAHPYKELKDNIITLGKITLDRKERRISFPAKVSYHADMPVEVILCREDSERSYETLFVSEISPLHLQTVMYLAGYMNGMRKPGNKDIKQGSLVDISVQKMSPEGVVITKNITDFLTPDKGEDLDNIHWVFVGSNVLKGELVAELSGESIISWCVSSVIIEPDNEDIASGKIQLNLNQLPEFKNGTEVEFIITPFRKK